MDRVALLAWRRHSLLPVLAPGEVVVMDNLNVHKEAAVRMLVEGAGHRFVLLPAYSPDFSPIEGAYSKRKTQVRRSAKRTQTELEAAIGTATQAVMAQDAAGWFAHCGYHPSGHPL